MGPLFDISVIKNQTTLDEEQFFPLFENAAVTKFTTRPVQIQRIFYFTTTASTKTSVVAYEKCFQNK